MQAEPHYFQLRAVGGLWLVHAGKPQLWCYGMTAHKRHTCRNTVHGTLGGNLLLVLDPVMPVHNFELLGHKSLGDQV